MKKREKEELFEDSFIPGDPVDGLDGDYEDKEDRDDYEDDSEENVRDMRSIKMSIKELIEKGKRNGTLSTAEILEVAEEIEYDPERLD